MKEIEISGRKIGPGHPCLIIAEAGVNHNGDVELARRLIDAGAEAGVDAVKFQTFKAERLVSATAPKTDYQLSTTDVDESQLEMLKRFELPPAAHRELWTYSQERGVLYLSTPYDEESTDLLDELGMPAFKIGSGEVTNWPLLEYIARKGKPIILSTGMSYLSEVDEAVRAIRRTGNDQVVLLHCVSNYPTDPGDANLLAIQTLTSAFQVPVGFSDHTLGTEVALAAVALGARVIEKHVTLDRTLSGPDHQASLEPSEFRMLVKAIRIVERALGDGKKEPAANELENRVLGRRSLVATETIEQGTVLTRGMITAKRPGDGIPPPSIDRVIGRKARVQIRDGTQIDFRMIE